MLPQPHREDHHRCPRRLQLLHWHTARHVAGVSEATVGLHQQRQRAGVAQPPHEGRELREGGGPFPCGSVGAVRMRGTCMAF